MNTFQEIANLYGQNKLEEARQLATIWIESGENEEEAYFWRGKINYRQQKWGEAMNDFGKVLEINQHHQEAKTHWEMASEILAFYHSDLLNP